MGLEKMPLESNGVGVNSRRVPAESVVSAFQHPTSRGLKFYLAK
jgi:hypothetical protein